MDSREKHLAINNRLIISDNMISFKLKKLNNWLPGAAAGNSQQLLSQKDPGERELGGGKTAPLRDEVEKRGNKEGAGVLRLTP